MNFKLLIFDSYPCAEETAWFEAMTPAEKDELFRFRDSHREPFADAIESALWITGVAFKVKKEGWDSLKVAE